MAARKRKPDPAVLRTVGLFSGKTVLEEAEQLAAEEEASERTGDPTAMVENAEESAIRWLGQDAFHEGDDVRVALHQSGAAVMVLVSTRGNAPYATRTFKLTRQQWSKLVSLARAL